MRPAAEPTDAKRDECRLIGLGLDISVDGVIRAARHLSRRIDSLSIQIQGASLLRAPLGVPGSVGRAAFLRLAAGAPGGRARVISIHQDVSRDRRDRRLANIRERRRFPFGTH